MRKVFSFAFLFLILFSIKSNAQLSGTKSIPGDYATIFDAVTALNAAGVGSGGVTFQVAAGHTELTTAPINIKATGTAVDPIIFIKNGAGSNPLITRTDGGSLSTSTLGAQVMQSSFWTVQITSDLTELTSLRLCRELNTDTT